MTINETNLRPAVVFVDDERWESFSQLAAILRRAKIRTVRITVGPSGWHSDHLLFDRNVAFPSPPSAAELSAVLSNEYVADVHPTESLAITTYAALDLLPPTHRSDAWAGRSKLLDKWRVSESLRGAGLRSPSTLAADAVSPGEAVAQLSLPIVFKRRLGASGSNVNIFETMEALETFVATIEHPGEWFFERFVHGEALVCASCVSREGIDVVATYEVLKRISLRGPSSVVMFRKDETLAESTRVLVESLHIRGLMCFDVIRDRHGVDWIHDVNARVFGGFSMSQLVGFDFRGAYIHFLLGQGPIAPSRLDLSRAKSFDFPEGRKDLFRSGHRGAAWLVTSRWVWRNWRLLGSRYFLFFTIERPVASFRRNWNRLQRQGSSLKSGPRIDGGSNTVH